MWMQISPLSPYLLWNFLGLCPPTPLRFPIPSVVEYGYFLELHITYFPDVSSHLTATSHVFQWGMRNCSVGVQVSMRSFFWPMWDSSPRHGGHYNSRTNWTRLCEMGETAGSFTLRAWFIPLGNLFSDYESPSEQCSVLFVSFDLEVGWLFAGRTINRS